MFHIKALEPYKMNVMVAQVSYRYFAFRNKTKDDKTRERR